ncbi:MAG TPA: substrate-binding domain-containing protein, partial [Pseudomonas sp.]|nr:substrate-binding domain-containing protein [Pseudomonas sp.]
MPRALPADDQETWSRTLTFLILGFICYALPWSVFADALPTPTSSGTVLHIQGSNTIGARLGPALIRGMLEEQGLSDIRIEAGAVENEQQISGRASNGRRVVVTIAAHGSGTGFTGLRDGSADLAASSRPIKDAEASALASLGDLKSAGGEQIIAIDGLAIILHPSNPIVALRIDQLAQIFSGEVTDWSQLGGNSGRIRLYARDDNSGTYDTFKELVLSAHGKALAPSAQRFESSEKLSDSVSQDPQ